MKICFWTLGCRVNAYESQKLADLSLSKGFDVVEFGANADVCIINSCALTSLAQTKTRRAANKFMSLNPSGAILLTGCMAQTFPKECAEIKGVKWVLPNTEKMSAIEFLSDFFTPAQSKFLPSLSDRMNLKIQDGCDNFCSYCIIPRARGLPRSMDFDSIIKQAREYVERGVRELILTGINICKFTSARGGLVELIDEINAIPNLMRIRIGSLETTQLPIEAILERAGDSSHKLMPHLHISSQSLSDKVLQAMRRKYLAKDFLNLLDLAVEKCPNISIGTDIICGHPEEDDAEFKETYNRVKESPLAYLHVFTFSPRPLTLAAKMKNTPPKNIRAQRANILRELAEKKFSNFIKLNADKEQELLLENPVGDTYFGYTQNYIKSAVKISKPNLKNRRAKVRLVAGESLAQEPVPSELVALL